MWPTQCFICSISDAPYVTCPDRLTVGSGFGLRFWTRTEIGSGCSHFQPDPSRVAHIFNPTRPDPTGNWVNPTRPAKDPSLAPRGLNIENFPVFGFCITFLHYLLIGSHKGEHEGRLVGSHKGEHGGRLVGSHKGEHGGRLVERNMKGTMKAVRPSYLHQSNILSGRVGFSGRVIGSSFSTRPDTFPKKFQPDPTRSVYLSSAPYVVYSVLHM